MSNAGRHVFGVAAIAFGVMTLAWHDYNDWDLLHDVLGGRGGMAFVDGAGAFQIFGGLAVQFRRTAKIGAIALGVMYLFFASLWVPRIVAAPRTFDSWGSFFEQCCLALGAAFVYAIVVSPRKTLMVKRVGRILLGVCTVSFTLEQALHLDVTAGLVPKWIPPSPMFWANATSVAFALAALALLVNRTALLASRLMTVMILMFGMLVWVPLLFSNPRDHGDWGETIETFAIAGAVWVFADLLGRRIPGKQTRGRRIPQRRRAS